MVTPELLDEVKAQTGVNDRQALMAAGVASGLPQYKAYQAAGYTANSDNSAFAGSSRMVRDVKVKRAVSLILRQVRGDDCAALNHTRQSLLEDLEGQKALAIKDKHHSAGIRATELQAKMLGHLSDKVELEVHKADTGALIEAIAGDDLDLARALQTQLAVDAEYEEIPTSVDED